MKLKLLLTSLFFYGIISAQTGINYKGLVKDGTGNILGNTTITVQFEIIETSATGTIIYQESHNPTTDANGVVILNIGEGTPSIGVFSTIDWGADDHFLNVEIDTGTGLMDVGTTQFKAVPYALNATNVGLEAINEGNGIGHRIKGRNINNLGPVGLNATDISVSPIASTSYGATGESSFAANSQTTAQGRFATAFGLDSKAYGNTSVVMGFNTVANGYDAVAMGSYTVADASQSFAIGRYNIGGGHNQIWNPIEPLFEIGNGTGNTERNNALTVLKNGKMGLGVSPSEDLHVGVSKSVLFGDDTQGAGDKLMWLPNEKAFRVGGVTNLNWDSNLIGDYSFASGLNTIAEGTGSFAVGNRSWARNLNSFASGYFTNAHGAYSTAMGYITDALAPYATAFGYITDATGNFSTSMGHNTQAQAYASTAIGRYNVGGGNATSWEATDPLFEIGIGSSNATRSNAITVLKNGNVGIGTVNPTYDLDLFGDLRVSGSLNVGPAYLQYVAGNNLGSASHIIPLSDSSYRLGSPSQRWQSVHATVGTIQTSDKRLKTNITKLKYGLEEILKLEPVSFNWKDNPHRDAKLGLIAQDILKVIPEVVNTEEFVHTDLNDPIKGEYRPVEKLGVFYSDIIPVLIKAIQEQQDIIINQRAEISTQGAKIEMLSSKINEIQELTQRMNRLEGNKKSVQK